MKYERQNYAVLLSGTITLPEVGEVIMDDKNAKGKVIITK